MSHRQLMNFVHGGGMTSFHVGGGESSRNQRRVGGFAAVEREAPRLYQFSTKSGEHAYDSPKKREKKHDDGDASDDDSGDEKGPKKKRIYHPGEDADGDGKTGEGKGEKPDWSDKDGNNKPDFMEKKKKDKDSK